MGIAMMQCKQGAMFELSQYVPGSAIASLEPFRVGSRQYYILNKVSEINKHVAQSFSMTQLRLQGLMNQAQASERSLNGHTLVVSFT